MMDAHLNGGVPRIVIMGVAGSGKTTVGTRLAECLELPYIDGDDLHSPGSIAKMSSGFSLSDLDRGPWLVKVGRALAAAPSGCVVSCSALARRYRDQIRVVALDAFFVHLLVDRATLALRMSGRSQHFMPVTSLDSQLATLEALEDDERGLEIDAAQPVDALLAALTSRLS